MKHVAEGIMAYASIYVVILLLAVTATTGRFVFLFFILLTIGLAAYVVHQVTVNPNHFARVGKYVESKISNSIEKLKLALTKTQVTVNQKVESELEREK